MSFGYKPDPVSDKYWKFDKKEVFGTAKEIYNGDVDLRKFASPIKLQGPSNACVAFALTSALELKRIQKFGHDKHVQLSTMDLYYGARDLVNPKETNLDGGSYISIACDVLRRFGVCREEKWPFDLRKIYLPPSILATRESYMNKITSCYKIKETGWDRVDMIKSNLLFGNPVVGGFNVDKNWINYNSSSEPLAPTKFENIRGKHAINIVGFVNNTFIIQNSWNNWGDQGFGYLRPETLADSGASDFWVITDASSDIWRE